jgi:hypothetical protein
VVDRLLTRDRFHEGRFAAAVAPDQRDALAGFERQSRAIEQWRISECERHVFQSNERHVR